MTSLEERYLSGYPVLQRLGRADADGVPVPSPMISKVAPDLWRMIGEACFGVIWNRPGLTLEQRSMSTISVISALRRDDNLRGHVESGLDVGFTPTENRGDDHPDFLLCGGSYSQHRAGNRQLRV